jgi:hypothetical protein
VPYDGLWRTAINVIWQCGIGEWYFELTPYALILRRKDVCLRICVLLFSLFYFLEKNVGL